MPRGCKVFYLKRIRLVDGEPLIVLNNYVVYDACPGVETVDFTTERLFQVLEERYGLKLAHGRRTFQAQVADREIAHLLEMKPGDAVMNVEQLAFLEDGTVIECSDLWLRGDCFRLIAAVSRTGNGNVGFSMSVLPGAGSGTGFAVGDQDQPYEATVSPRRSRARTLDALRCGAHLEALFLLRALADHQPGRLAGRHCLVRGQDLAACLLLAGRHDCPCLARPGLRAAFSQPNDGNRR